MSRVYYPVQYRLDHRNNWLIWHSDNTPEGAEADGIVVNQSGLVPVFRTHQNLTTYAGANYLLPLEANGSAVYNFDAAEKWLKRKRPAQLDCAEFLGIWNLLTDLSATISDDFDPDKAQTQMIYSKLFWGSNLPAVTPPGKRYKPVCPGRESRVMRQVLKDGLLMFRSHVIQAGETQ